MKKTVFALTALAPVQTLAHGSHMPVPAEFHDQAHLAPWLALVPVVVVAALALWRRLS